MALLMDTCGDTLPPGHVDWVAATMPSQAHAGAAQEAPDIGQWEGQDVPLVRPSSCIVKGGIQSSRRYLPTYLDLHTIVVTGNSVPHLPLHTWHEQSIVPSLFDECAKDCVKQCARDVLPDVVYTVEP